ncbi:hypothetical protein GCM10010112_12920 [Actinoplanes lobatus]|uniref:Pvc16 N-terminal domain-containing protein n=1 Tax=Actinoplanes lobatus TaxID=113568 RepID=A0A7W7HMD4_9ACTN|nr:Pvc16 family protein [Actinoplanes lobatus]MBB4753130.1 hypothetical protein [Actinoplanes lobatus]GGN58811.1 hypothetical protein GCM10010112_12920 [Actinoplanes lobatus]GIE43010.1 hypothetical protein Alo02nite_59080 [Actinoplanes lobatus]
MFQDLDLTLKALLEDTTVAPALTDVDIAFDTPDKSFTFTGDTLNLFLFGVHENRVLRDPVPIVEVVAGQFVRRTPPLRVDCDYLLTAWSEGARAAAVRDEHRLLAAALAKLTKFPLIPPGYLRNSMTGQPFPVQTWVGQADDSRSLGEFWSALGVPPRSAFHLTVTVALDLQDGVALGPPVETSRVLLDAVPRNAIGGRVRAAAGNAPVDGATVTLDGRRTVRTGAEGGFVFTGVGDGQHELHVTAAGFSDGQRTVTVPGGTPTAFDFTLTP